MFGKQLSDNGLDQYTEPAMPAFLRPLIAASLGAACAGSLVACQAPEPPAGPPLNAAALRSTLVGNTARGTTPGGAPFASFHAADGAMRFRGGGLNDSGVYRITEDGKWCSTWRTIRGGAEACQTVVPVGAEYRFILPSGVASSTVRVVPGNPDNL